MIAGPLVSDNGKKVAQGDNDNNNKDATKDDNNGKTKQHEQYRSPYELRPGDECSTQLNIVDDNCGLMILPMSSQMELEVITRTETDGNDPQRASFRLDNDHNNDDNHNDEQHTTKQQSRVPMGAA